MLKSPPLLLDKTIGTPPCDRCSSQCACRQVLWPPRREIRRVSHLLLHPSPEGPDACIIPAAGPPGHGLPDSGLSVLADWAAGPPAPPLPHDAGLPHDALRLPVAHPGLVRRIQRDETGALFLRESAIDHIWSPVPSVARCRAESSCFAIPNRVCGMRGPGQSVTTIQELSALGIAFIGIAACMRFGRRRNEK